jgi:hypothetical protein
MAEKRPSKVLSYLGLIIFGIVLALIMLEVGMRILYPITPFDKVYMSDPILHHRLIPNTQAWYSSVGEFRVHFRVNSHGLVGDEIPYEKPEGEYRILIMGDSFMQARQVAENESTASQLEAYLNEQGNLPPVKVINAGTDLYGTANETLFLEQEGLRYDPDLVILVFLITNDVADNLSYAGVDWQKEGDLTASDLSDVILREEAEAEADKEESGRSVFGILSGAMSWATGHSLAAKYGIGWLRHNPAFYKLLGPAVAGSSVQIEHQIYSPQPIPEIETAWDTTDQILQRYARIGSEHDVPVMVVIWPDAGEYNPEWWERRVTVYTAMEGYDRFLAESRLTDILEERSIPYMSLEPTFEETWKASGSEVSMNFERDGHPTAFTHHLAAETIGSYLLAEGLIPSE